MMAESYRGFVNAWECDENDHLNVQGYVWRFELAARHFLAARGGRWPAERLRIRHIRYWRECATGDLFVGQSAADGHGRLFHALVDPETGLLLASSVETFDADDALPAGLPAERMPETAGPRSIAADADDEFRDGAGLEAAGYRPTFTGIVGADAVGPEGTMADRGFIAGVSDGVAHAWANAGFTKVWFDAANLGRVAVEMKLSIAERPAAGRLFRIVSGVTAVARSTLTFRHVLLDAETGGAFATVNVSALTMDLASRRSVPLPDAMRDALADGLVG